MELRPLLKRRPVVALSATTQYLTKVAISVPTELLAQIDKRRQDVTRSRFIVRILENYLQLGGGKTRENKDQLFQIELDALQKNQQQFKDLVVNAVNSYYDKSIYEENLEEFTFIEYLIFF